MIDTVVAYDSTADTLSHIGRVNYWIGRVIARLEERGRVHDKSKLEPPEKEAYDESTPALRGLTYGSQEYKDAFKKGKMPAAIEHHYAHNDHHPEHYNVVGIAGMSAMALTEMICDWKAASERHADGKFPESLNINRKRFRIEPQLFSVIVNTCKELGFIPIDWIPSEE